jgi:FeS assembly SUF system regulator
MLRLTRLADYATVLMCRMASEPESIWSASQLAGVAGVSPPTAAKLLKLLTRAGLLTSLRGGKGGYQLSRGPDAISVADVIAAVDGPLGLTECTVRPGSCGMEDGCGVRANWTAINTALVGALANVSLSMMRGPGLSGSVRIGTLNKMEVRS